MRTETCCKLLSNCLNCLNWDHLFLGGKLVFFNTRGRHESTVCASTYSNSTGKKGQTASRKLAEITARVAEIFPMWSFRQSSSWNRFLLTARTVYRALNSKFANNIIPRFRFLLKKRHLFLWLFVLMLFVFLILTPSVKLLVPLTRGSYCQSKTNTNTHTRSYIHRVCGMVLCKELQKEGDFQF